MFACVQKEFLPVYQQQLKDMIIGQVDKEGPQRDRPLEGLKVVVNAGNGMGGFLADTLTEVSKTPHLTAKSSSLENMKWLFLGLVTAMKRATKGVALFVRCIYG